MDELSGGAFVLQFPGEDVRRLRARGAGAGDSEHRVVAQKRLDVLVVVDVRARIEGVLELLLHLAAEGELAEQVVDLLPLAAVRVRVDRDDDRRPLRHVVQRGAEPAAGALAAAAGRDQDGRHE